MFAFAYEYPENYEIVVSDGTEINSFSYTFIKEQDIQTSVNESLLLAEHEIASRAQPVPIVI